MWEWCWKWISVLALGCHTVTHAIAYTVRAQRAPRRQLPISKPKSRAKTDPQPWPLAPKYIYIVQHTEVDYIHSNSMLHGPCAGLGGTAARTSAAIGCRSVAYPHRLLAY